MITNALIAGFVLVGIWLLLLSIFVFKYVSHYKNLLAKTPKGDLKKVLDGILKLEDQNSRDIKKIYSNIEGIEKEGLSHIQKLGLVRYNPFSDTGGDHSFSLAVLDGNGSGFVLTGLHTRDRTRFYIKSIKEGKASRELSNEEKRSVEIAFKF